MSNDNGLVDEYEKLENLKKDIELEEELKKKIIDLAREKNTDILFGNHKKCSIKEYGRVVYPEDKTSLLELINKKGLYSEISSVSYPKLNSRILKGQIDKEVIDLVRIEKAFRLSLREI